MNKDLEIWKFVADRLEKGEPLFLLVVTESSGSSPGRQGFKMAVSPDSLTGSIGGGVMEVSLVEKAREMFHSGTGRAEAGIVERVHRKDAPNSSGMICSGDQTIAFIEPGPDHLKVAREIIDDLENRRDRRLRITDSELGLVENEPGDPDFRFEKKSENGFLFEEKLGYKNKLFIVGGGHCALALSELMSKMDFYIALFDDRPGLNTLAKNRFADEKTIIGSYEKIGDFIKSGSDHYVVVMTLGYKFDEIVVRRLFEKDFKYFGVLGSRAKMAVLWRELLKEGFDKDRLERIYTPVGLPINSRTPEEIAVSIAAEIISVKNKLG
jgi:xanthine dehydrogenase accessory factor